MTLVPEKLHYTKTHEWFTIDGDILTMGITDYAQKQLTDVVFVDLPKKGEMKKKNEPILTIESVKSAEDVFSPADGEVIEVNAELEKHPELINSDPYGTWMVRLKVGNSSSLSSISAEDYKKLIGE